jgi:hypothetical protein
MVLFNHLFNSLEVIFITGLKPFVLCQTILVYYTGTHSINAIQFIMKPKYITFQTLTYSSKAVGRIFLWWTLACVQDH